MHTNCTGGNRGEQHCRATRPPDDDVRKTFECNCTTCWWLCFTGAVDLLQLEDNIRKTPNTRIASIHTQAFKQAQFL